MPEFAKERPKHSGGVGALLVELLVFDLAFGKKLAKLCKGTVYVSGVNVDLGTALTANEGTVGKLTDNAYRLVLI